MPRRKLLALISIVGILAATACSDITAPSHKDPSKLCPVTSGGDSCH